MRQVVIIAVIGMMLLAGCRGEDTGLVGDPVRLEPATIIAPDNATVILGCETADLETWLEAVLPNAQLFRDESFGVIALPPDGMMPFINQLGGSRDAIHQAPVPECMTIALNDLQDFMDVIMRALVDYSNGVIDQVRLVEIVTTQHVIYDEGIKPQLDEALAVLDGRFGQPE